MSSFAPGPWHTAGRHAPTYVVDANHNILADCDRDAPNQEAEANARLMAAVPELLDACKTALGNIYSLINGYPDRFPRHAFQSTADLLAAAIARAEGTTREGP